MKLKRRLVPAFVTFFAVFSLVSFVPLQSQQATDDANGTAAHQPVTDGADSPLSRQKGITVMVELRDAPAAQASADALKTAQAQVDAQRNYALAHPKLRTSKTLLSKPAVATTINASAARQVANVWRQLDSAQRAILPSLTGGNVGGRVLFRATRAYNGIAMVVSPDKIAQISALPGVKAVHPMHPKFHTAAFSDVDFQGRALSGPNRHLGFMVKTSG